MSKKVKTSLQLTGRQIKELQAIQASEAEAAKHKKLALHKRLYVYYNLFKYGQVAEGRSLKAVKTVLRQMQGAKIKRHIEVKQTDRAIEVFMKSVDAANVAIIEHTLAWALGADDVESPADFIVRNMRLRKKQNRKNAKPIDIMDEYLVQNGVTRETLLALIDKNKRK